MFRSILKCQDNLKSRDRALWEPLCQYDKIWIFGAGRVARRVYTRLRECNFRIAGFIVTCMKGNPNQLFDLPVHPIETLVSLPEEDIIVVAMASTMHAGPSALLREKGFPFFLYYNNKLTCPPEIDTETQRDDRS